MFGLGTTELIVVGAIVFFIFGAKRLPEIGKGLGGAIREFKQIKKDINHPETTEKNQTVEENTKEASGTSIDKKLGEIVVKQVPVVKKAVGVKEKVNKIRDIIDK